MNLVQTLVVALLLAVFATPVEAKGKGNNNQNNDRALYKTEIQAMLGL